MNALEALEKLKRWAMFEIETIDDIRQLEESYETIKAALDASEWKPIESAPKDGTTIMLLRWSEMMPEIYSAWWMPLEKSQGYDGVEYDGHCWVLNDDSDVMIEDNNDLSIWYWMPFKKTPSEEG